jgi:hypothetical protein
MSYVCERDGLAACPDDAARVADFIEPTPTSPTDMLNVLADRYQFTNDGRNAAELETILSDNDFWNDMPYLARAEILRHAAKSASVEWQHTRKHLVDLLEEIGSEE